MVGRDFAYEMGTGYCGKIQPIKVDAHKMYCNSSRFTVNNLLSLVDACSTAVKEAVKRELITKSLR
jgi:hypothetical protein